MICSLFFYLYKRAPLDTVNYSIHRYLFYVLKVDKTTIKSFTNGFCSRGRQRFRTVKYGSNWDFGIFPGLPFWKLQICHWTFIEQTHFFNSSKWVRLACRIKDVFAYIKPTNLNRFFVIREVKYKRSLSPLNNSKLFTRTLVHYRTNKRRFNLVKKINALMKNVNTCELGTQNLVYNAQYCFMCYII